MKKNWNNNNLRVIKRLSISSVGGAQFQIKCFVYLTTGIGRLVGESQSDHSLVHVYFIIESDHFVWHPPTKCPVPVIWLLIYKTGYKLHQE